MLDLEAQSEMVRPSTEEGGDCNTSGVPIVEVDLMADSPEVTVDARRVSHLSRRRSKRYTRSTRQAVKITRPKSTSGTY